MGRTVLPVLLALWFTGSPGSVAAQDPPSPEPPRPEEPPPEEDRSPLRFVERIPPFTIDPFSPGGEFRVGPTAPKPPEEEPERESFIAPFLSSSPQLGLSAVLVGGWIIPLDPEHPETPPSILGAGGFFSENDSFAGFAAFQGYFDADRWRVTAAGAYGDVNYDFYGIGNEAGDAGVEIPITTESAGGVIEGLGRIAPHWYLGPRFQFVEADTDVRRDSVLPPEITPEQVAPTDVGLGLHLQADTRDDTFYPRAGTKLDARVDVFREELGSDLDFEVYSVEGAAYPSIDESTVLASRAVARSVGGDPPYYRLSQYDLRGYERGRYRDRWLVATECEVRRHLGGRFSGVAFASVGGVARRIQDLRGKELLWGGGVGLRFRLTEETPLHYRVDVAWGKNGSTFYLSLAEAF